MATRLYVEQLCQIKFAFLSLIPVHTISVHSLLATLEIKLCMRQPVNK